MFVKKIVGVVGQRIPPARSVSSRMPVGVSVDDEGIAVLTMQRPSFNGFNLEMLEAVNKQLDAIASNKYKGMILNSALPTIFSGGLDIMEMYKPDLKRAEAFWNNAQDTWLKLFSADYITTSAINGHAPGGGCLIALACEYRAMVHNGGIIGLNEIALGIPAQPWIIDTMTHHVPMRQAELALTSAKLFTTDEALKVGLIDDIAKDKQDAIEKCKEFIRKFDNIDPQGRSVAKRKLRERIVTKFLESRKEDTELFLNTLKSPVVQQNLQVCLEKLNYKNL